MYMRTRNKNVHFPSGAPGRDGRDGEKGVKGEHGDPGPSTGKWQTRTQQRYKWSPFDNSENSRRYNSLIRNYGTICSVQRNNTIPCDYNITISPAYLLCVLCYYTSVIRDCHSVGNHDLHRYMGSFECRDDVVSNLHLRRSAPALYLCITSVKFNLQFTKILADIPTSPQISEWWVLSSQSNCRIHSYKPIKNHPSTWIANGEVERKCIHTS